MFDVCSTDECMLCLNPGLITCVRKFSLSKYFALDALLVAGMKGQTCKGRGPLGPSKGAKGGRLCHYFGAIICASDKVICIEDTDTWRDPVCRCLAMFLCIRMHTPRSLSGR